jgi:3-hydroxyacyl-CoA dehydrogenase
MTATIQLSQHGSVAIITVDNPPVNAMSQAVRAGLQDAMKQAFAEDNKAIVLNCAGRTFIAGADISEFGKPPADPSLPDLLRLVESSPVPVIAAIHGTALGGGLETAMSCHYRIASPSAKLGLPEVSLGLLPGAGGTQLTPRLIGVEAALGLMTSGKPISSAQALKAGLLDHIAEGDLLEAALAFADELISRSSSRTSCSFVSITGFARATPISSGSSTLPAKLSP